VTASYAALLGQRPARRLVYALVVTTLGYGMYSLTVLLTVEGATGSYREAGFAVAAFALFAASTAPLRGRLIDRRGVRHWLPALALGYAAALVALDVAAHAGAPAWVLVLLAGCSGVSAPPIFASARPVWAQIVDPVLVRRGYAVTSLLYDVGQIVGPVLASALFLISSWPGAILCGALPVAGAFLSLPAREGLDHDAKPAPMPRLRETRALIGLLAVSVVFGGGQGVVIVAVPAAAAQWDQASLAGTLLALFAAGSVSGALWYGTRHWKAAPLDRYLFAVLAFGVLLAPAAVAGNAAGLGVVLFLAGLAFGPATVSLFESLDVIVPGGGAEALTWVTTGEAAGSAVGSAVAGVLATRSGIAAPFLLAAGATVVVTGAAVALRHARRPVRSP
jgi:predicted MFS family arabinose efflux permease